MVTVNMPKRLPMAVWGTIGALVMALFFALPASAAEPVGLPILPNLGNDVGKAIQVQGPRQILSDDLTVERGEVIEEDVTVYAGDVEIKEGGRIAGNLLVLSGDIEIAPGATVDGDVTNASGDIKLAGHVGGDLAAMSGDVELEASASVGGDVSVVSGSIRRDEGASVGGNVVQGPSFRFPGGFAPSAPDAPDVPNRPGVSFGMNSSGFMGRMINFVGRVFAAALMTALAMLLVGGLYYARPQIIVDTRKQLMEKLALSAVVGGLANLIVLFLAGLLAITVCLLPLALIPMLLLLAVNVVGWAVISQIVGEKIVSFAKQETQPALTILVGAFFLSGALAFLWALGGCFQFVASLLIFAVSSLGTGAALLPWINRQRGIGGTDDSGSDESGGGDTPPADPKPAGPAPTGSGTARSAAAGTPSGAPPSDDTPVEHDVSAPLDYVTAEEVNSGAERGPSGAARGSSVTPDAPSEVTTEGGEDEPVELDVAAPGDYITAQEINTTEVVTEDDDFLQIKGIGPTFARRLKDAGYATYAQLAAATPDEIAEAIGWPASRVTRSELIDQAKVLAQR